MRWKTACQMKHHLLSDVMQLNIPVVSVRIHHEIPFTGYMIRIVNHETMEVTDYMEVNHNTYKSMRYLIRDAVNDYKEGVYYENN